MIGPRRRALRAATSRQHRTLDRAVGRIDDLGSYRGYLRFVAEFHSTVESALARHPAAAEIEVMRLTDEILADCRDLRVIPPPARTAFAIADTGEGLMGTLYVLEGSALGARMLLPEAAKLGLDASFGARHLSKQSRCPRRWLAYLDMLETAEVFSLDDAMTSAVRTFDLAIAISDSHFETSRYDQHA